LFYDENMSFAEWVRRFCPYRNKGGYYIIPSSGLEDYSGQPWDKLAEKVGYVCPWNTNPTILPIKEPKMKPTQEQLERVFEAAKVVTGEWRKSAYDPPAGSYQMFLVSAVDATEKAWSVRFTDTGARLMRNGQPWIDGLSVGEVQRHYQLIARLLNEDDSKGGS
jgi:hypothetical protein